MLTSLLLRAGAFAVALAVAGALAAPQASASSADACRTAWDSAPADEYCSNESIRWMAAVAPGGSGCVIDVNCTVTVNIGEQASTFQGPHGAIVTVNEMSSLTLCFGRASDDPKAVRGWLASLESACPTGQIDVETAVTDGLASVN